jgi:hypothetical protein
VTTFRDQILAPLDLIRGVGDLLGLRLYTVTVRKRVWSGTIPGDGTPTDTDVVLKNARPNGVSAPVMLRQLSRKEVIASGGLYVDRDVRVGPMTPAYAATSLQAAGGYHDADVDPATSGSPTELFYIVSGPGWPSPAGYAEKVGEEATALHFYLILRSTGRQA